LLLSKGQTLGGQRTDWGHARDLFEPILVASAAVARDCVRPRQEHAALR
jgi:hypothetical protein